MSISPHLRRPALALFLFSLMSSAYSDDARFDVGARVSVLLGDGVPANDIIGPGIIGRYHLRDGWFIGFSLDSYEYDFEEPADRVVGIPQDPTISSIDASATNVVLAGSLGRQYGNTDKGFDWFWTLGVGAGFPDVDDVSGPTEGGGMFDLTADAKTEIHLMGSLGTSFHFNPNWYATFAARFEHHFMDITVTDRVTGMSGTVDSQSPLGGYLGITYSFR